MKILVYTRNFLPDMGGLERNTFTLASSLTAMGHGVTVLTETLEPGDAATYPFATVRSSSRSVFYDCIKKADLVFVNGGLAMKICTICWFLNKKYVPIYQMSTLFDRDGGSFFSKKIRRHMAGKAVMSATVSHYAKGVLEKMLPGHPVVALPNPIDAELAGIAAEKGRTANAKTIDLLFAGRLIDGKGIFHLLEAVEKLKTRLPLTVAFAGDGEDRAGLLARAKEMQLDVDYLGRLDREQLIDAYLRSKALVVPSSTHTEGNPLVIAEALSVGIPVIASDQPAMVEGIGDAGYVFKRGSADDLSDKIGLLFSGENLAEKTRNTAGRKGEYSHEKYVSRLAGILEKLAAPEKRAAAPGFLKNLSGNLLASLISVAVLLGILEIGVRAFGDKSYYSFSPASTDWVGDPVLGWSNKPLYEHRDLRYGKIVEYKTNADGFRPASVVREKQPGTLRVLLIGNSTVAARDMGDGESIHFYLDSLLDLSGVKFEVINAGVTAYATDQALLTLKKHIGTYRPDFVCYGYCVNDLYANLSHEYSGLRKPRYKLAGDSLVLETSPEAEGQVFEEPDRFSPSSLIQHSALYGELRPYIQRMRMAHSTQTALEQGGMHDFDPYLQPTKNEPTLRLLARLTKEMDNTCRAHSAKFFLYAHPDLVGVWQPYREAIGATVPNHIVEHKLQEIATENGFSFVPFVDYFLERKTLGPFHHIPKDPHCNAIGYQLEAQVLAPAILNSKQTPSL